MTAHHDMIRTNYDIVAPKYADMFVDQLAEVPVDRAMLGIFAELVGPGTVGDLGCGPGRIATYLYGLGLTDLLGIDLSPAMIAEARRRYPGPCFEVGSIDRLDGIEDGGLAGAIAWYSIIHTPRELVPALLTEFRRVVRPGGPLLVAFQSADPGRPDHRHIESAYGYEGLALDAWRWDAEVMTGLLGDAGFAVRTTTVREPEGLEPQRQAFLLAV